jgi:hypothetical protein
MIFMHCDFGTYPVEFQNGQTVATSVQKLMDDRELEIRGDFSVQETQTGRVLDKNEEVVNLRYYYLTAFTVRRKHRTP